MSKNQKANMAASVKQRVLNLARERNEDFNFLLARYTLERFLFRLSRSEYADRFVLKGAMLFHLRSAGVPHRATHDLDLLGWGSPELGVIMSVFQSVCDVESQDDGVVFDAQSVRVEPIKDDDEYNGVRVKLSANMGTAQVPFQIDVGFGDAIYPLPQAETLSTLLDFPAPYFKVYPWESVIAEKLHAMIVRELDNSRLKDYFDLHHLASTMPFDGSVLSQSIRETFDRRKTALSDAVPIGLSDEFAENDRKQAQWKGFLNRLGRDAASMELGAVVVNLRAFLLPVIASASKEERFDQSWKPGGPWE